MDRLLHPHNLPPEDPNWRETPEGDIVPSYTGINGPISTGELPGVEIEEVIEASNEMAPDTSDAQEVVLLNDDGTPDPELTEQWRQRQKQKQPVGRRASRRSPVSRIASQNNAARHVREHTKRVYKQVR